MSRTVDIVVAGAGHNSLITAAYLAKAGYEVLVLDARPVAGGGAVTEELSLPGFKFDSCSTGHTLIQPNPVLRDDELGLKRDYGLEYVQPDPIAHARLPGRRVVHALAPTSTARATRSSASRRATRTHTGGTSRSSRRSARRSGATASTRSATRRRSTSCCATSRAGCAASR